MGLWGAAQAIAFGCGGVIGTAAVDVARHFLGSPAAAYSLLFAVQGILFVLASGLAIRLTAAAALAGQDQLSESSFNASAQAVGEAGARMT